MKQAVAAKLLVALMVLAVIAGAGEWAAARKKGGVKPFRFEGGTMTLPDGCKGLIEVGNAELNFKCTDGSASVSVPYEAITLMQYRPDISRKVRKMKINWKVKPGFGGPLIRGRGENRLFAVIYQENGSTGALVLEVPPETMRPYLAEIDVKSGKRVEVKETEEVD